MDVSWLLFMYIRGLLFIFLFLYLLISEITNSLLYVESYAVPYWIFFHPFFFFFKSYFVSCGSSWANKSLDKSYKLNLFQMTKNWQLLGQFCKICLLISCEIWIILSDVGSYRMLRKMRLTKISSNSFRTWKLCRDAFMKI